MSSLPEIESAVRALTPSEKQRLMLFVAKALREEQRPLPAPRSFDCAEIEQWMNEDERAMENLRGAE